jgi:hypothetical protein
VAQATAASRARSSGAQQLALAAKGKVIELIKRLLPLAGGGQRAGGKLKGGIHRVDPECAS